MTNRETDMKKAASDEQNLRTLINNTDDPIWLVDLGYNIVECNKSFKKWVSCFIGKELNKGDNVLYNGLNKIYHEKFEMCYQLALNGRSFKSVEDMYVDGLLRYTSVTFNPVFDADGTVTGVSCCARDITEQRKHLLRIEAQNEALREIAFIESHKVRGPVATIMGLVDVFNIHDITHQDNKDIAEGLLHATRQLDDIIREVVRKSNEMGLDPY